MAAQNGRKPVDYKNYGRASIRRQRSARGGKAAWWWGFVVVLLGGGLVCWWLWPENSTEVKPVAPSPISTLAEVTARQQIYDRNLETLATSFPVYAVYVKPLELNNVGQAAAAIAKVLGLDTTLLQKQLLSQRTYVWLGRRIPVEQAQQLLSLNLSGLYFRQAAVRFYPHYNSAAQVVGYVQDNHGLSGVELYYDQELLGQEEPGVGQNDGDLPPVGRHVVLTLDLHVQTILEKQMALLAAQTKAASVSALVVNTATGGILAYAQLPSFDPNLFWEADSRNQHVKMINTPLQPGAISGLFRLGAALYAKQELVMPFAETADHIIVPRIMKKGSTSQGGHWWNWPKGGYISSELAELPDPSVSDEQLLDFQNALGISCADRLDLPEKVDQLRQSEQCGQGNLNGISLLGGFCRLMNGGKPVQLHVKRGALDDDGNFEPMHYKSRGHAIPAVSKKMLAALAEVAGQRAKFFAVEYLAPLPTDKMIVTDNVEMQGQEESARFDGVLLATGPSSAPQLAMLVVVENGRFEHHDASPMRRWVGRFFNGIAQEELLSTLDSMPDRAPATTNDMYKYWLREIQPEDRKKSQTVLSGTAEIMPDLKGKSLRKALTILQAMGVEVDIRGAGQVVAQQPAAGDELQGQLVLLTLGQRGTTAGGQTKNDRP